MKKMFILLFAVVFSLGIMGTAKAALIDNGGNLIYDTDLNITWYSVANNTAMNWWDAKNWAENQTLGGLTGWRLPNEINFPGPWAYDSISEMGHLYFIELGNPEGAPMANVGPFSNLFSASGLGPDSAYIYWTGTEASGLGIDRAFDIYFETGHGYGGVAYAHEKIDPQFSLAVHDGNIGPNGPIPTPEPATMLLLSLGLMGLASARRKIKK